MHSDICAKIEELREQLNKMNVAGVPYDEILELSMELDEWIVCSYGK